MLTKRIATEDWRAFDPYYNKNKHYRALPLRAVLEAGFEGEDVALDEAFYVLEALDGYQVPIAGKRLLEPGSYIAIADLEVAGWQPIGPQSVTPGPFYFVWRGDEQQELTSHPRPWQLAVIAISPFEQTYRHTVPTGEPAESAAMQGFAIFREQCVRCHAVNREGGRIGPDLNVPQSIVEYRPRAQIRAYIRDPHTFRYSNMPANPHLSDSDLEHLLAYFDAMRSRKYDPDKSANKKH